MCFFFNWRKLKFESFVKIPCRKIAFLKSHTPISIRMDGEIDILRMPPLHQTETLAGKGFFYTNFTESCRHCWLKAILSFSVYILATYVSVLLLNSKYIITENLLYIHCRQLKSKHTSKVGRQLNSLCKQGVQGLRGRPRPLTARAVDGASLLDGPLQVHWHPRQVE